jgi:hypothetical protein
MRKRIWLTGLLLAGLFVVSQPAHAGDAIWPFSLFSSKKQPAKKPTSKTRANGKTNAKKTGKPAYGARTKAVKPN